MDSLLFKWHVKKNKDSLEGLAKAMEMHPHTLYMKYRGGDSKQQFTQREIAFIAKRYNLTADEVVKIFFADYI